MYCAKCGSPNDPNAFKCVSCGAVMVRSFAPGSDGVGPADSPLVWAILVTIFCCIPFGIVAIVYAAQVGPKNSAGLFNEAHEAAGKSRTWCWVAFACGLVVTVIWVALNVMGGARP